MNNIMFPRGELKRRAQEHNLLTESVFDPESGELKDIQIITLRQHLLDKACDEAWNQTDNPVLINEIAEILVHEVFPTGKEFVNITDEKITVGVDANEVDDSAVNHALFLLTNIDDLTTKQQVEFGEVITVYGNQI